MNPAVAAARPATLAVTVSSLNHDLGWILLGFGIFTLYATILISQTNLALFITFLLLFVTLIILAIGNFNAGSALLPTGTIKFGGYVGLVTALAAWYTSAAGMSAGIGGKLRFPVGPALNKVAP